MPVDDPNTHLELTMIHEVIILDYSGIDLGFILYGASIKLFLFMAFVVSLLWPQPMVWNLYSILFFFIKMTSMALLIGIVESMLVRWRFIKIPQLLMANFILALFAFLVALSGKGL